MYTRKRRDSDMEPWGTPAATSFQYDCWAFRTIFRDVKKFYKTNSSLLKLLFLRSLNVRTLCQTLSNAFEISRETVRVFKWIIYFMCNLQKLINARITLFKT